MNLKTFHQRRSGFTLIELMVVVMIITLLATVVLMAMFSATETARAARSRSMVARINDLLVPIWESYQTRRVPIAIPPGYSPQQTAQLRLNAIRELMRMELPDRKSDVEDAPVTAGLTRPALSQAYQRTAIARAGNMGNWTPTNESPECLYLILSRIQDGDTNGLEFLRETEIQDTDNDGMPEIVDGWGTPIAFYRWPAGFLPSKGAVTALQDGTSPDAFDPLGVYPGTYYLFPLVASAGPDRVFDCNAAPTLQYSATTPTPNNPYPSITPMVAEPDMSGGKFADNITNHLLSTGTD